MCESLSPEEFDRVERELDAKGLLAPPTAVATRISREEWDALSSTNEVCPIMITQDLIFGMKKSGDFVAAPLSVRSTDA